MNQLLQSNLETSIGNLSLTSNNSNANKQIQRSILRKKMADSAKKRRALNQRSKRRSLRYKPSLNPIIENNNENNIKNAQKRKKNTVLREMLSKKRANAANERRTLKEIKNKQEKVKK